MKKLYRVRKGKCIAGVCGGIAKSFEISPQIVRLFFALFVLAYSSSLIIYIILMIVIPKEPKTN
ncbi:PspC domain-containing protein [Clostridioides difficile]|nr:PspC domain-containing protein [Clostridioides difficile]MDS6235263.1 PspC domain-containing protein [Clostridioides difficile]MDU8899352.1 PspC domain-containing protein [Clostridioides difficile]